MIENGNAVCMYGTYVWTGPDRAGPGRRGPSVDQSID